jgi:hypothetical protein
MKILLIWPGRTQAKGVFASLGHTRPSDRVGLALDIVEAGRATISYERPGGGLGLTRLAFLDGSELALRPLQAGCSGRSIQIRWSVDQAYRRGRLVRRSNP